MREKTCYFLLAELREAFQQAPEKYCEPGTTQTPSPG